MADAYLSLLIFQVVSGSDDDDVIEIDEVESDGEVVSLDSAESEPEEVVSRNKCQSVR